MTLHLKPAEGRLVRHPKAPFAPLAVEGEPVTSSTYWRRRLAQGDVVAVEAQKTTKKGSS